MELVIMPDGYHVRVDLKTARGSVTVAHGLGSTRSAEEFIELFQTDLIAYAMRVRNERRRVRRLVRGTGLAKFHG